MVSKNSSNINCIITTAAIASARHCAILHMHYVTDACSGHGRTDCLGCRSSQQAASSYCASGMESWAESGLVSKLILSLGWPANDWVMWDYEGSVISAQHGTSPQAMVAEKLPVGSAEAVVRVASQLTSPSALPISFPSLPFCGG